MVKAFSVASWNVEHFKSDGDQSPDGERVERVISYLKEVDPDVFGIYEVTGKEVYFEIVEKFPTYTFQITEGQEVQEILAGVRNNLSCFFTQRLEFKSAGPYMRPGLLASIKKEEVTYNLLFLHLASFPEPRVFWSSLWGSNLQSSHRHDNHSSRSCLANGNRVNATLLATNNRFWTAYRCRSIIQSNSKTLTVFISSFPLFHCFPNIFPLM